MLNIEEARKAAIAHIESAGFNEISILDSQTKEFEVGWVFFYQSARFLESNDFQDMLVGNAPVFVPRNCSPPATISYHRRIEESIVAFKACGDANGNQIPIVSFSEWENGASAVKAIKALRRHSSLGLADAKYIIDECLGGRKPSVTTIDVNSAHELVRELIVCGFVASIRYRGITSIS